MKQVSALATLVSLVAVLAVVPLHIASADGPYRPNRNQQRVVSLQPDLRSDMCRLGWWQTLRYGHVQPEWGVRCARSASVE